jgi:hypothetical protein
MKARSGAVAQRSEHPAHPGPALRKAARPTCVDIAIAGAYPAAALVRAARPQHGRGVKTAQQVFGIPPLRRLEPAILRRGLFASFRHPQFPFPISRPHRHPSSSSIRSRGADAPEVWRPPPIEGRAERRQAPGANAHPRPLMLCRRRANALSTRGPGTSAEVPTSHDAGGRASRRSAVAIFGRGPRFRFRHFLRHRAASSSQPGRSAWRAGSRASRVASGCEPPSQDATPCSAFRTPPEAPLDEASLPRNVSTLFMWSR